MKMLAFAMIIVFLTFLGLGVKFSRWEQVSKICCIQLLASTIQLLCISTHETLLHVTLKGKPEIFVDINVCLSFLVFPACLARV